MYDWSHLHIHLCPVHRKATSDFPPVNLSSLAVNYDVIEGATCCACLHSVGSLCYVSEVADFYLFATYIASNTWRKSDAMCASLFLALRFGLAERCISSHRRNLGNVVAQFFYNAAKRFLQFRWPVNLLTTVITGLFNAWYYLYSVGFVQVGNGLEIPGNSPHACWIVLVSGML